MSPNYPDNCWYVAATSDELSEGLLARTLLDRKVVLYRSASGEPVALEDRCAHRGYPLSVGRLEGDRLVCSYHGFTYDTAGRCVDVPSQDNVPHGVCVRSYAVYEQPPFVWIWLGTPGASTLRPPPSLPWLSDDGWTTFGDVLHADANYLLLHEHYLDLTHVFVVHPEAVPPGVHTLPPLEDVEVSETSVSHRRVVPAAPLADWEAEATGLARDETYERREYGTFVSPAIHIGRWEIDGGERGVHEIVRVQGFTPETATSTHVFLRVARNYALDRSVVTAHLEQMFRTMADEDVALLERLQQAGPTRAVNITADRAALRARRIAEAMVAEQAGRAAVRPGYGARGSA
jgi:vanillate O-demethylase monooxygenase subunit